MAEPSNEANEPNPAQPGSASGQGSSPKKQTYSGVMPSSGVMVGSSGYPDTFQGWSPAPGVYTPQPPQPARPAKQAPPAARQAESAARVTSVFLYVKSIEKSVEFYTEALGAVLTQKHAEAEGGPVTLAILRIGDFSIMLHMVDENEAEAGDARPGAGIHIQIRVADVDKAYDRACDAGYHAKVSDGPIDQEWGWREFAIKDPDGFVWSVYQDKSGGAWA